MFLILNFVTVFLLIYLECVYY